jgi:hypothetical protein
MRSKAAPDPVLRTEALYRKLALFMTLVDTTRSAMWCFGYAANRTYFVMPRPKRERQFDERHPPQLLFSGKERQLSGYVKHDGMPLKRWYGRTWTVNVKVVVEERGTERRWLVFANVLMGTCTPNGMSGL